MESGLAHGRARELPVRAAPDGRDERHEVVARDRVAYEHGPARVGLRVRARGFESGAGLGAGLGLGLGIGLGSPTNMSRPCKLEGDTARSPQAAPGKYPRRAAPHVALPLRPVVGAQRPCNRVRSSRPRAEQSPLPLAPAAEAAQKPQLAHLHQR